MHIIFLWHIHSFFWLLQLVINFVSFNQCVCEILNQKNQGEYIFDFIFEGEYENVVLIYIHVLVRI